MLCACHLLVRHGCLLLAVAVIIPRAADMRKFSAAISFRTVATPHPRLNDRADTSPPASRLAQWRPAQAGHGQRLGAQNDGDVDQDALLLAVRKAKPGSARTVPLHETTAGALRGYARLRDRHFPEPASPGFFVSARGTRLAYSDANKTFRELIRRAGLQGRGERRRPRAHDLRHSFAVATVLRWYREGADVDARLPLLSAMLGHADPASTYWYLQAAPELLALVAQRLQQATGELT